MIDDARNEHVQSASSAIPTSMRKYMYIFAHG